MHLLDTLDLHHASHDRLLRDRLADRAAYLGRTRPGRRRWVPSRWPGGRR